MYSSATSDYSLAQSLDDASETTPLLNNAPQPAGDAPHVITILQEEKKEEKPSTRRLDIREAQQELAATGNRLELIHRRVNSHQTALIPIYAFFGLAGLFLFVLGLTGNGAKGTDFDYEGNTYPYDENTEDLIAGPIFFIAALGLILHSTHCGRSNRFFRYFFGPIISCLAKLISCLFPGNNGEREFQELSQDLTRVGETFPPNLQTHFQNLGSDAFEIEGNILSARRALEEQKSDLRLSAILRGENSAPSSTSASQSSLSSSSSSSRGSSLLSAMSSRFFAGTATSSASSSLPPSQSETVNHGTEIVEELKQHLPVDLLPTIADYCFMPRKVG